MPEVSKSKLAELFSDIPGTSPEERRERGERFESLAKALEESITRHDRREDGFLNKAQYHDGGPKVGLQKGAGPGGGLIHAERMKAIDAMAEKFSAITKGLSPAQQAEVQVDLEALQALKDQFDVAKDISTTVPGDLHPYDLEAPAKVLVPRFTPLRNEIPRTGAEGLAREYRRILGWSNTGLGGVSDLTPFFNSETGLNGGSTSSYPSFGALTLIRGAKISYDMDTHVVPYMEMSLSDAVGWKASFADLGFQNVRALSQMALLWAHLLGEEKALLWGRGAAPYAGAVAAPTVSGAEFTTTGGSGFAASAEYYVKVCSNTKMGSSEPYGTEKNATTADVTTAAMVVELSAPVSAAISYDVYIGTSSGGETFQGTFLPQAGGTYAGYLVVPTYVTGGAAPPASDTSSNADAYDGIITTLLSGGSGPSGAAGYAEDFSTLTASGYSDGASIYGGPGYAGTNVGDKPWQDMFASLYASVYADPEEVWLTAVNRRQLADWFRSNTSAGAYRINMSGSDFEGGLAVGGFVSGMANESSPTDRIVDLRVHPYMPPGISFARTRSLPVPDSHIGDPLTIAEVQGYMSVDWPEIQFTYDASTYWFGTLLHYAPAWFGILKSLQ
jgi:hypothetical protein